MNFVLCRRHIAILRLRRNFSNGPTVRSHPPIRLFALKCRPFSFIFPFFVIHCWPYVYGSSCRPFTRSVESPFGVIALLRVCVSNCAAACYSVPVCGFGPFVRPRVVVYRIAWIRRRVFSVHGRDCRGWFCPSSDRFVVLLWFDIDSQDNWSSHLWRRR